MASLPLAGAAPAAPPVHEDVPKPSAGLQAEVRKPPSTSILIMDAITMIMILMMILIMIMIMIVIVVIAIALAIMNAIIIIMPSMMS